MEDKLFELVGLGVPFYLAAATYGVFAWLDSNASDEATKVISSWLHGGSQHKPDLGNLIINTFDRIYTTPLLSFRAFRRSAAISTTMWVLVYLTPWLVLVFTIDARRALRIFTNHAIVLELVVNVVVVMVVDYVSLLFVRRFLNLARLHPINVSIMSSVVGFVIVAIGFIIYGAIAITIVLRAGEPKTWLEVVAALNSFFRLAIPVPITTMASAFIIHLWLPLFALSSLAVRLVYLILRAVEWAQWFLKQGDAHPFKAIGIVATIIVFGSAMLVKEAWTYL
jgi:hypothetical protein